MSCGGEKTVNNLIKEDAKKSLLKSKAVNNLGIELTYEVRVKNGNTDSSSLVDASHIKLSDLGQFNMGGFGGEQGNRNWNMQK